MRYSVQSFWRKLALAALFLFSAVPGRAATEIGPWNPIFKGVEYSISTNIPGSGDFLYRQVCHALRIDLHDPDISFFTTPQITNYVQDLREVAGYTVSDFLATNQLQLAINANFFDPGSYYLPAGTPMDVNGLQISEGVLVSPANFDEKASLMIDSNNVAQILHTNWPAASTEGIYTAISGDWPLVYEGVNIRPRTSLNDLDPRTAFGLSEDGRYLYIAAIDGRQPGYSDGASHYETAGWMVLLGAYHAIDLDGGGSTTLVMQDTTGIPVRLNRSSAVADSGRERTVGSHFGIYAKPVIGFINDVAAVPEETAATITWTTIEPSASEVQYGVTTALGESSGRVDTQVTEHQMRLAGLTPGTGYYYRILARTATDEHISGTFYFKTTRTVTTNEVFGITHAWKYATSAENPSGNEWTGLDFDDSGWGGPGDGLLWVDTRTSGPNAEVNPRNTEMPANGSFPYISYFFRTRVNLAEMAPGSSLLIRGYIDDGAIFYLNGTMIYRLRMPLSVSRNTLASGFPCEGDATCLDEFEIPLSGLPSVVAGENVLAVEVHNYNARSNDITFGISLSRLDPAQTEIPLLIMEYSAGSVVLRWEGTGFTLQSAPSLGGEWSDLPGASSPVTLQPSESARFYRLKK